MKWIGTDQGKEIVEVDGVTKAVDRAEFEELFPEHAPQATEAEEVTEEATEAEEAKPKKGKTQ